MKIVSKIVLFIVGICYVNLLQAYEIALKDSDFQPSASFNANIGLLGAYISEQIYSDHYAEISSSLYPYGFKNISTHEIKMGVEDTQFLVASKEISLSYGIHGDLILIAFRGTSNALDTLTDLDTTKRTFSDGYSKVHKGFYDSMKLVKSMEDDISVPYTLHYGSQGFSLRDAIDNADVTNTFFLITGHSLGGAIATLYAADLIQRGVPKSKILVYTYGAPAVGDENFVSKYDGQIYYHRVRNQYDPVPFSAYIDTLIDSGNSAVNITATWLELGLSTVKNLWNTIWGSYPYKHIGYMRVFDKSGDDITDNYQNMSIFSSGKLLLNISEHSISKYISNLEKYAQMQEGLAGKVFCWNGNASVVGYNSGDAKGFGLTKDITKVHAQSTANPVVFFQWQKDSKDGKNLKIYADSDYHTATIYYGSWDSASNEKKTYKNVTLPFVLDPTLDGFSAEDGQWFTIAVSFNHKPTQYTTIHAEATDDIGTNLLPDIFLNRMNLKNNYYWSGNGSLISYTSGDKTGYGLTKDVAVVYPDSEFQTKPSVFFQWEVDSLDGKKVKISSHNGCFDRVKITKGNWSTRENDTTINVTLPYTISTDKEDGGWVLLRVDLLDKPFCKDYVKAEIVK